MFTIYLRAEIRDDNDSTENPLKFRYLKDMNSFGIKPDDHILKPNCVGFAFQFK